MNKIPSHLTPSRAAKRSVYEEKDIHSILDEALFCTISYVSDGKPFSIPTSFARHENKIYIHGSVGSHFIRSLEIGIPVCITIMLADALVLAKAAFSHSVNYRSVVIFAEAEKVEDPALKLSSFKWLIEKIAPKRWGHLRPITDSEIRRTAVLAFKLNEASAKVKAGMPNDDAEDKNLPIWSGIIPLQSGRHSPIADASSSDIPLPNHLQR